jgi:hypothetical protein
MSSCVVCEHEHREIIDALILEGTPNHAIARRFGFDVGSDIPGDEVVRQHRAAGHVPHPDEVRGRFIGGVSKNNWPGAGATG